jgi:hypothetical protein
MYTLKNILKKATTASSEEVILEKIECGFAPVLFLIFVTGKYFTHLCRNGFF